MKKVGLAVCYDTKNFGSQLQVLATIRKIEEFGFDTEIIRYRKKITPVFLLQTIPRFFNIPFVKSKLLKRKKTKQIANYPAIYEQVRKRNERFSGFAEKYFKHLSVPYCGWETLVRESAEKYDIFLCGSDQLWLPHNLGSHFYTLEFAPDDKPKIAYATSFGVSQIPSYQKKRTEKYLNRFKSLSTREIAGKNIIRNLTGKDVPVVCDPTLLFNADGWSKMISDRKVVKEPYIFCYFLGTNPEHRKQAEKLKKSTGLQLITCPFLDNFVEMDRNFGDKRLFDIDSEDFVNLIRHADYILTDSFHGTVFSILHHKKFLIFDRFAAGSDSRNSRIDSLCELLHLHDRRFKGDVLRVKKEINYELAEDSLGKLREESAGYLRDSLS